MLFQIRELRHDNVNVFIGAVIRTDKVFIVTQSALRKSLEVTISIAYSASLSRIILAEFWLLCMCNSDLVVIYFEWAGSISSFLKLI